MLLILVEVLKESTLTDFSEPDLPKLAEVHNVSCCRQGFPTFEVVQVPCSSSAMVSSFVGKALSRFMNESGDPKFYREISG